MCAGTQEKLKDKLKEKLGNDKVGEMFCLVTVMKIMRFITMEKIMLEKILKN